MLSLAMDINQVLANALQHLEGDCAAIDATDIPSLKADFPRQHKDSRLITFQAFLLKQRVYNGLRLGVKFKDPFNDGPFGACPHKVAVAPPAQEKTHSINDDRLARASLAGEHIEAGLEPKVNLFYDGKVADGQFR
jgi:hypothetical protein